MKTSIYIFVLSMLAVGSVVAQDSIASASQISAAAEAVTITDQGENTIFEKSSASDTRPVSSTKSGQRSEFRRDDGKASRSVPPTSSFDYGRNQISERIIDRLGLFDHPDDGGSGRYSASLELENEDSDWSFQVTFTVEF